MDIDKLKRFGFGVVGAGVIAGNHKMGLNLDLGELGVFAGFVVSMVGQSAWKEVRLAGAAAAAKINSVPAALALINSP